MRRRLLWIIVIMLVCFVNFCKTEARAEDGTESVTYEAIQTCEVNGTQRTLMIDSENVVYYKVDEQEPFVVYLLMNDYDLGLDRNGATWTLESYDNTIRWWCYDFTLNVNYYIFNPIIEDDEVVDDVESLIFDEEGFVTGYKKFSGEIKPILTYEAMKYKLYPDGIVPTATPAPTMFPSVSPDSTESPEPTIIPTVEPAITPIPSKMPTSTVAPKISQSPASTESPDTKLSSTQTSTPTKSQDSVLSQTVSIKQDSGYSALYIGNQRYSAYKLKKVYLRLKEIRPTNTKR